MFRPDVAICETPWKGDRYNILFPKALTVGEQIHLHLTCNSSQSFIFSISRKQIQQPPLCIDTYFLCKLENTSSLCYKCLKQHVKSVNKKQRQGGNKTYSDVLRNRFVSAYF